MYALLCFGFSCMTFYSFPVRFLCDHLGNEGAIKEDVYVRVRKLD